MAIPENMELVLGNRSDELIQMIAMTVAGPDRKILAVEPSFVMYRMIALFLGMEYYGVSLKPDFSLDMDKLLAENSSDTASTDFLAYPNNPTGNLFNKEEMLRVIEAAPGLVVIDEAYAPLPMSAFFLCWVVTIISGHAHCVKNGSGRAAPGSSGWTCRLAE